MSTSTRIICDQCGCEIDFARPSYFLCPKRKAPSCDVDLCSVPCIIAFAVKMHPPATTSIECS